MPVEYVVGRAGAMLPALARCAREAILLDRELIILVPRQLTLETEIALFDALGIEGSFRLQICSTARFLARVFEETGAPEGERIDEQGRAMALYRAASACAGELVWYKDAFHRRGFSQRALKQMQLFQQAGLDSAALRGCADAMEGSPARHKLRDLALLMEGYDQILAGRYQDGEGELREAIARLADAAFLRQCAVCFYGFDLVPPLLEELIAAVACECQKMTVFCTLDGDQRACDADVFLPARRAMKRLDARMRAKGLERGFVRAEEENRQHAEIAHLARELFSRSPRAYAGAPKRVRLMACADPNAEAMAVASLCRELARAKGWRYREMRIVSPDAQSRRLPLMRAFALYGVPLSFSDSRSASQHPLGRALTGTLRLFAGRYRAEDVIDLVRTGYMNIPEEEADRFVNFIIAHGLRGNRFKRPVGDAALESVREAFFAPIEALEAALRAAKTLREQLTALFEFLQAIDAYGKCEREQERLIAQNERTRAGESAQVWNRILSTLDQLCAIMGEKRLSLKALTELIEQALAAVELKGLPQSADAVAVQPLSRTFTTPVKALLLVGMADGGGSAPSGLLTDAEQARVSGQAHVWLGPDGVELARVARMYLLSALGMAQEAVYFSYSLSAMDGSPLRPALAVERLRRVFPELKLSGEPSERVLSGAVDAAVYRLSQGGSRAAVPALARLPEGNAALARFTRFLGWDARSDALGEKLAARAFGDLARVSASRLEQYAQCPFRHFVTYGLAPQIVEPFALKPVDEGSFFHEAVRAFLSAQRLEIQDLPPDVAATRMESIADGLLDGMMNGPLGDTAVSRAERRRLRDTARRAAWMMAEQMRGSQFEPVALEVQFGDDEPRLLLHPQGGDSALYGRIDRVDQWKAGGYLRVIDYKRGGRALKMEEVYGGLQLQLMIYLAAALKKYGGKSAGAYYFAVADPVPLSDTRDPQEADALRKKNLRLDGVFPDDPEIVRAMATDPQEAMKVRLTKDGEFYKGTQIASPERFEEMMRTALDFCERYVSEIRAGRTDIAPIRRGKRRACDFCDYKAICAQDGSTDRPV